VGGGYEDDGESFNLSDSHCTPASTPSPAKQGMQSVTVACDEECIDSEKHLFLHLKG
jgi:hypothetical protein